MVLGRRAAVPLGTVVAIGTLVIAVLVLRSETQGESTARSPKPPDVRVARSKLGRILVDAHGRTLYLFLEDAGSHSSCYGGCARVWPPALASGHPKAGDGVKASELTTSRRRHVRARQLVYNHHPLYTTVGDERPGQTAGQGYFGSWFVVSPSGRLIGKPSKSGGY
jgi:predicted lipoprotein with Yx(FWY)xxD motif